MSDDAALLEWRRKRGAWRGRLNLDKSVSDGAVRTGYVLSDQIFPNNTNREYDRGSKLLTLLRGVCLRTVGDHLGELEDAGYLYSRRRGFPSTNCYGLSFEPKAAASQDRKSDRHLCADQSQSNRQNRSKVIGRKLPASYQGQEPNTYPPAMCAGDENDERGEEGATEKEIQLWLDAFVATYPIDPTMSFVAIRAEGAKLSQGDRDRALKAAQVYRAAIEKRGGRNAVQAVVWLRGRRFDEIGRLAGVDRNSKFVFVAEGSPEWAARVAAGHPPTLKTANPSDARRDGWHFPAAAHDRPPPGSQESTAPIFGMVAPRSPAGVVTAPPFQRNFGGRS